MRYLFYHYNSGGYLVLEYRDEYGRYRPQLYVLLASGSDKVIPRTVRIKISTHYYSKIILGVFLQWKTTQFWNKSRQTV